MSYAVLRAVVLELYDFAVGRSARPTPALAPMPTSAALLASAPAALLPPASPTRERLTAPAPVRTSGHSVTPDVEAVPCSIEGEVPHPAYVAEAALTGYLRPVVAFDTAVASLPYGAPVLVEGLQGRWAAVRYEGRTVYVHKDGLCDERARIYPSFSQGVVYGATHPETIKLRALSQDAFGCAPLVLPVQAVEYVSYRLAAAGRVIAWPAARPRPAGAWQQLLCGVPGTHLDVAPATGAVMEYLDAAGEGHLAYVEAVHPDASIRCAEVGLGVEGRFASRTLSHEAWRALAPVFISVT